MIARVVEPFHEGRARHAVRGDGARQAVLLERRPVLRANDLDGFDAELLRDLASLFDVPFIATGIEAPEDDRVFDASVEHGFVLGGVKRVRKLRQSGGRDRSLQ